MLYALTAGAIYETLGSPNGAPAIAAAVASYLFATSIGLWVLADARRRGRALPYDYGAFVFFGWMVVVPLYLWWTRRWRGVIPLSLFAVLYALAVLLSRLPQWL